MKWDRAMSQVLTLVLIMILMAEEASMIGPVNETDQPVVVKINRTSSERQQWIDERRLTSTVDSVASHDIPPDRITSKRLKLIDKINERDTGDKHGDSNNNVDHYMSDNFKKRETDNATSFDNKNKQLGRIAQGTPYTIERFPYLVQVMKNGNQHCGGTLITYGNVLTAARCFLVYDHREFRMKLLNSRLFSIRYGATQRNRGGVVIQVDFIAIHPDYENARKDTVEKTDLALVSLSKLIPDWYPDRVARLPSGYGNLELEYIQENELTLFVAGWGRIGENQSSSGKLLGVNVKAMTIEKCRKIYKELSHSKHMCAYEEGKDACQGDSGGGLFYDDIIYGVAHWRQGCAQLGYPGVYARVDSNMDWVYWALARSPATNQDPKDHLGLTLTWWIPLFAALNLLLFMPINLVT